MLSLRSWEMEAIGLFKLKRPSFNYQNWVYTMFTQKRVIEWYFLAKLSPNWMSQLRAWWSKLLRRSRLFYEFMTKMSLFVLSYNSVIDLASYPVFLQSLKRVKQRMDL